MRTRQAAIDNKGGLKKQASVKIGERFWDILVLGDASEKIIARKLLFQP